MTMPVPAKICGRCKVWKPLTSFERKSWREDGRSGSCKDCGHPTRKYLTFLLERDGYICAWCKKPLTDIDSSRKVQVDHIVPKNQGGTDDPDNLQLLHRRCNIIKGNKRVTGSRQVDMPKYEPSDSAVIAVVAEGNPKRPGFSARTRFGLYRTGMTVGEFRKAGGLIGDIYYDISRGYIAVSDYPYGQMQAQLARLG